jgi:hypothetical protein
MPVFLRVRAARKLRIAGMQPAILAVRVARTLATAIFRTFGTPISRARSDGPKLIFFCLRVLTLLHC